MALLKYTTTVPATKSIGLVRELLKTHGAQSILESFNASGETTGMQFLIKTQEGTLPFAMPARVEKVQAVLATDLGFSTRGSEGSRKCACGDLARGHHYTEPHKCNWCNGCSGFVHQSASGPHAQNVAWRILLSWLEAQMALIEIGMAEIQEVFLPYLQLGDAGETLYKRLKESGFKALPAPSGEVEGGFTEVKDD